MKLSATFLPFLLLLSPSTSAQTDGGWKLAEAVVTQAGDQILTTSELERDVLRRAKRRGIQIQSREEMESYMRVILPESMIEELEVQAGEDLGLDPLRIERAVRLSLEGRREELGPNEFRDFLQDQGLDAVQVGLNQQDEIYRSAWVTKQVGYAGGGERPIRDRYIRPGELRAIYRANRSSFGKPALVRFQDLVVPVEALGGDIQRTKSLVENLRERAVGGEDFDQLVEEFGAFRREDLGRTEQLEPQRLSDASLRDFATNSEVGAFTSVLPIIRQGETIAWHVIKLDEREEGTPPPAFGEPRLQRLLRTEYLRKRDNGILKREQDKLRAASYIWHADDWQPLVEEDPPAGPGA